MPSGVYDRSGIQYKKRKPLSPEAREHLSAFWKGKKKSPEHIENIRKAKLGENNPMYRRPRSLETRTKASQALKGIPRTEEWRHNLSKAVKRGPDSNFWRGGVATANNIARHSVEYKDWRTKVFQRDNYTCQRCKVRGGKLQADHIKPFAYHSDLRYDVDNGRTLCEGCHRATETWGAHGRKQYEETFENDRVGQ